MLNGYCCVFRLDFQFSWFIDFKITCRHFAILHNPDLFYFILPNAFPAMEILYLILT